MGLSVEIKGIVGVCWQSFTGSLGRTLIMPKLRIVFHSPDVTFHIIDKTPMPMGQDKEVP